ncbi:hypothetical protein BD560DRAFT_408779 [Blakeslea trispora]|nr:hypothetical protein BD560DRAFT_408779 [Blakeslea trispora]
MSSSNLIGEVKPFPCSRSKLALDTYRLGVFSVALLSQHNLKHILAFQTKGLEVTFYLCFYHLGSFVMTEIEIIDFPSTTDEYCQFGTSLDALYNVCSIYEQHCHQQQQQQESTIFPYDVLKSMYELSTSKHTTQATELVSSTDTSTNLA